MPQKLNLFHNGFIASYNSFCFNTMIRAMQKKTTNNARKSSR